MLQPYRVVWQAILSRQFQDADGSDQDHDPEAEAEADADADDPVWPETVDTIHQRARIDCTKIRQYIVGGRM